MIYEGDRYISDLDFIINHQLKLIDKHIHIDLS